MRIDSSGNVGIGTASPANRLDVSDGQATVKIGSSTTSAGNEPVILLEHAGNNAFQIKGGANLIFSSDTGTNERMRITTAGNVGIGTTSPISKLTAAGSGTAPSGTAATGGIQSWNNGLTQMVLTIDSNSPFTSTIQAKHLSVDDAYYPISLNPLGGNVGIGTTSPGSKLDVNGELRIGNTVNTVSPTSPDRTITMVIGGTTYYIHAKTTND
jgi:hypothetical protein